MSEADGKFASGRLRVFLKKGFKCKTMGLRPKPRKPFEKGLTLNCKEQNALRRFAGDNKKCASENSDVVLKQKVYA